MSAIVPGSDVAVRADQLAEVRVRRYEIEGREFPFEMLEHPDGVYIDLPNLDYLNDWALGYSAFKTLNSSGPDWWWDSPFNTIEDQRRTSTPALRFGEALHCGLLEPEGELEKRFGTPPDPADPAYKDYARTIPELKAVLKELQLPQTGNKPDLIARILDYNPKAKIFDVVMDEWKRRGLTELTSEQWAKLRLMIKMAELHPHLKNSFTGKGLSEVSIFWTDENGVRQRARLDRVKPKATIDLKSFSNWQGRDFKKALLREAALREYPMQVAHYDIAREVARQLIADGKVYFCAQVLMTDAEVEAHNAVKPEADHLEIGAKKTVFRAPTEEEAAYVVEIMGGEVWEWVWVFYKTDGAPTAQPVRLDRGSMAYDHGAFNRKKGLGHFLHYREQFGLKPGEMWLRLEPMMKPTNEDWPAFMDPNVS